MSKGVEDGRRCQQQGNKVGEEEGVCVYATKAGGRGGKEMIREVSSEEG